MRPVSIAIRSNVIYIYINKPEFQKKLTIENVNSLKHVISF